MSKLEIEKILTLSTAHISEGTANMIEQHALALEQGHYTGWAPSFSREYGWMFFVANDFDVFADAPADLRDAVRLARDNNCTWLMLDQDGPEVDQLSTFEW